MKVDIKDRNDIFLLVNTFYQHVQKDTLLGPIFNGMISPKEWPIHIEKLTDFWETNLFGVPKFKGSPTQKHIQTDAAFDHNIQQKHFKQWLFLWKQTIDSLFEGDLATRAQMAAHNIAEIQHMVIRRQKPKEKRVF